MAKTTLSRKTYSIAAYKIEQLTVEQQTLLPDKVFPINGIGDAIGKKILELTGAGKMKYPDELISKTPEGILELKGIGSKKISIIWKEMNVENIGELLYACYENRLSPLKGFGKKHRIM